jgi:hypothetical protein
MSRPHLSWGVSQHPTSVNEYGSVSRRSATPAAALSIFGVALLLAALAFAMSVIETPVETYSSISAADSAGAFNRWLPRVLPAHGLHLREAHSLDAEEMWVAFTSPISELRAFVAPLDVLPYAQARQTASHRPWRVRGDWPPELSESFWHTPRSTELLSYHRDRAHAFCFAVEWSTGRTWGWSCKRVGQRA